jgi:membrane protein DedA with SNARE-associated domain
MDSLINFIAGMDSGWVIYLAVFTMLLVCGLGVPIPEDVSLFAAGLACYYGQTDIRVMLVVSLAGVMVGDTFMFAIGRRLGTNIFQHRLISRVIHAERIEQVRAMMEKRGNFIFFAARFMPGVRSAVFFSAGAFRVPFRIYFLYDGLAALISVPLIVYTSYYFGDRIHEIIQVIRRTNTGLISAIAAVILIVGIRMWLRRRNKTLVPTEESPPAKKTSADSTPMMG